MNKHIIIRFITRPQEPTRVQVCMGASPFSGTPYWGDIKGEAVLQPLTFSDGAYAKVCMDQCRVLDQKAGDTTASAYATQEVAYPDWDLE